jgi:hypothetical protein
VPLVEEHIAIAVEPQLTWDYLADPGHLPVWDSAIEHAEQVEEATIGPGIRWRGRARLLGRRIPWETEFVECEPPHRRVQRSTTGPLPFVLVITMEAVEVGTQLTYRVEAEPGLGGLFGRIADPFVARVMARSLRASLQTLKGLLEGEDHHMHDPDATDAGAAPHPTAESRPHRLS